MTGRTALVTGATGFLGRQVVKALRDNKFTVKGTGYSRANGSSILKVDLNDPEQVKQLIQDTRPDVIVHCAANRFPDKVDKDPEGTRKLNVEATRSLARACVDEDILLIYISTDYVFSGKEGEAPYDAKASPDPSNLYGRTKLEGEQAVIHEYNSANRDGWGVVLRVPVLYGEAETPAESAVNVLMDAIKKAQAGEKVTMDHWSIRYPTNTEDVARVCHDIAVKYLEVEDKSTLPRILQFTSEDRFTKYEICQLFAEIMGSNLDKMIANAQGNDPTASVQRPYDCHLSTQALRDLGISTYTQEFTGWWRRETHAFRH